MRIFRKPTENKRPAFTLIELLIVIAIIAILALIAVPNFLEAQTRAKVATVKANMRTIATGIESYFVDNGSYPWRFSGDNRPIITSVETPGEGICQGEPVAIVIHDYRNYQGGIGVQARGLYTPVKYLSDLKIADDAFSAKSVTAEEQNINYVNFLGAAECRKLYADAQGDGLKNKVVCPAPVRFGNANATPRYMKWCLVSRGPDRDLADPNSDGTPGSNTNPTTCLQNTWTAAIDEGQTYFYDPSNGTLSRGNVWRCDGMNE